MESNEYDSNIAETIRKFTFILNDTNGNNQRYNEGFPKQTINPSEYFKEYSKKFRPWDKVNSIPFLQKSYIKEYSIITLLNYLYKAKKTIRERKYILNPGSQFERVYNEILKSDILVYIAYIIKWIQKTLKINSPPEEANNNSRFIINDKYKEFDEKSILIQDKEYSIIFDNIIQKVIEKNIYKAQQYSETNGLYWMKAVLNGGFPFHTIRENNPQFNSDILPFYMKNQDFYDMKNLNIEIPSVIGNQNWTLWLENLYKCSEQEINHSFKALARLLSGNSGNFSNIGKGYRSLLVKMVNLYNAILLNGITEKTNEDIFVADDEEIKKEIIDSIEGHGIIEIINEFLEEGSGKSNELECILIKIFLDEESKLNNLTNCLKQMLNEKWYNTLELKINTNQIQSEQNQKNIEEQKIFSLNQSRFIFNILISLYGIFKDLSREGDFYEIKDDYDLLIKLYIENLLRNKLSSPLDYLIEPFKYILLEKNISQELANCETEIHTNVQQYEDESMYDEFTNRIKLLFTNNLVNVSSTLLSNAYEMIKYKKEGLSIDDMLDRMKENNIKDENKNEERDNIIKLIKTLFEECSTSDDEVVISNKIKYYFKFIFCLFVNHDFTSAKELLNELEIISQAGEHAFILPEKKSQLQNLDIDSVYNNFILKLLIAIWELFNNMVNFQLMAHVNENIKNLQRIKTDLIEKLIEINLKIKEANRNEDFNKHIEKYYENEQETQENFRIILSEWGFQTIKWIYNLLCDHRKIEANWEKDELETLLNICFFDDEKLKDDSFKQKDSIKTERDFIELVSIKQNPKMILKLIYQTTKTNPHFLSEIFDDETEKNLEKEINDYNF